MDYKTACDTFEYNPNTGDILRKNCKLPAKNGTLAGTKKKKKLGTYSYFVMESYI